MLSFFLSYLCVKKNKNKNINIKQDDLISIYIQTLEILTFAISFKSGLQFLKQRQARKRVRFLKLLDRKRNTFVVNLREDAVKLL